MKIFILHSIWEKLFNEENEINDLLNKFWLDHDFTSFWCISWYFLNISDEQFLFILPILNGFSWKYFFYNSIKSLISSNYIFWKNILDFEFDKEKILENSNKIIEIKNVLDSNKLITNSKKDEFSTIITECIYNIWWFLIKTFFLMDEMISNKQDLQDIIENPNWIESYKSQAKLLDSITLDKLALIKVRFDIINLQLNSFSDILTKYFIIYIK